MDFLPFLKLATIRQIAYHKGMQTTEKEMELARAYNQGLYTEVQFNYLVVQNRMDKQKMQDLMETISYRDPLVRAAKVLLAFMMIHFLACLFYAISLC